MASSSNIFASNVFYSGNVFGPSGEQLTQGAALTQKIQDLAGGFSNGIPGLMTSSSIVGTGMAQSALSPFTNALEGSIYFPGTSSNYITTGGAGSPITAVNWATVSGGFTLELWANFPSFANASTDATSFPVMIGNMNNPGMGGPAYYWGFGPTTSGVLYFSYYNGSSIQVTSGSTLSTNTWYHLCVQSNGTNIFQFVNGTLASTTAISGGVTVGTGNPFTLGASYTRNPGPNMYIASARLTYGANLYSQGSFTTPTGPLGIAPTGQTVMLLRNPLYSAMTLKNPLNAQSSVRVRCLPSDALIYVDAFGSNLPNKAPTNYTPTFDPYGTGAVLFRTAIYQYLDFGSQIINVKTKGFTAIMKVQMVLSPSSYERIFQFYGAPSSSVYIQLLRSATASGFYGVFNNGSGEGAIGYPSLAQDVPYVVAMRYDPLINTWSLWINGVISVINSSSTTTPNDFIAAQTLIGSSGPNMNLYTFAAYNRALTDNEITDATAMLNQVAPVVPRTVEIGNVNGRPSLTVDSTGSVNVLGPLNGVSGAAAPVDLGINSLSLATGNLTSNIAVTSFSPLGPTEGSLYFPGVANTYIQAGSTSQPFSNSNIYSFGDFVVEAWVNPTSLANNPVLFGYGEAVNQAYLGWYFELHPTGQVQWFSSLNGALSGLQTNTSLTVGTWAHIAAIHQSSTKRIQIYINGQPQTFVSATGGFTASGTVGSYTTGVVPSSAYSMLIGQMYNSTYAYNGSLTNLRITTGSGAAQIYNNNAFVPSTSPLFPASNTAGGSLTTRLLVRAPLTKGQTNISKIGPASGVLAFPPAPMTTYATNLTGQSYYGQGVYVASASTEFDTTGTYSAWRAFDKASGAIWASAYGGYSLSTPYNYPAGTTTVDINGNSYLGEWIQIQKPCSIVPSSYSILNSGNATKSPAKWWILGSRDGTSWFLVDSQSSVAYSSSLLTFAVTAAQAFTYYRMVINAVTGSSGIVQFAEWTLNGSIESVNVTADGRVGLGVVNPTRALEVAGDVVCAGTLSAGNPLMFRNRIINGDMRIAQRGTSITASGYNLDRWVANFNAGNMTIAQSTSVPLGQGFSNSVSIVMNATIASGTAGAWYFRQSIEGYNVSDFGFGNPAGAGTFTVSFWLTSSLAGTMTVTLMNTADTRSYLTTISVGNYWQKYTLTIPVDAGATSISTTTASALTLHFVFQSGTSTTTTNTWLASQTFWLSNTTNYMVNGTTINITGVQLEKGLVATPFEVRPYATELALCQRYYYQITALNNSGSSQSNINWGIAYVRSAGNASIYYSLPVPMRAQPTFFNTATLQFDWNAVANLGVFNSPVLVTNKSTNKDIEIDGTVTGGTQGQAGAIIFQMPTAGQYVSFNAEL